MRRFALKLKSLLKNSALGLTLAACAGAALAQSITSEPLRPVDPFDVSALDRLDTAGAYLLGRTLGPGRELEESRVRGEHRTARRLILVRATIAATVPGYVVAAQRERQSGAKIA